MRLIAELLAPRAEVSRTAIKTILAAIKIARPHQWIKNSLVLIPLIFSGQLANLSSVLVSIEAAAIFSIVASAVYVFNDLIDVRLDRLHPVKRRRPIASGALWAGAATLEFYVLAASGLLWSAWRFNWFATAIIAAYLALALLYSVKLKQMVPLDMIVVAVFYVFRPVFGAAALWVWPTSWLIITTFFAALYLVSLKRRSELTISASEGRVLRKNIDHYTPRLLGRVETVSLSGAILCYAIYSSGFAYYFSLTTIPLVFVAIRVVQLVEGNIAQFGSPEIGVIRDKMVIFGLVVWAAWVVAYHALRTLG